MSETERDLCNNNSDNNPAVILTIKPEHRWLHPSIAIDSSNWFSFWRRTSGRGREVAAPIYVPSWRPLTAETKSSHQMMATGIDNRAEIDGAGGRCPPDRRANIAMLFLGPAPRAISHRCHIWSRTARTGRCNAEPGPAASASVAVVTFPSGRRC